MVNVTSTALGDYGYVLGGGPGNYTGYGYNILPHAGDSPDYQPQRAISGKPILGERNTYRARLLQTTNLATEYERFPKVTNATYVGHGLVHQGQLRTRRTREYNFPTLANVSSGKTSSCEESTKSSSPEKQNTTFVLGHSQRTHKKKPFVLPGIAKMTAGLSTIDTVFHPGFAKGFAASRADTGSLVNALRGLSRPLVHHAEPVDGRVGSIPDSEDSAMLVPRGYEDFYYTTLENLKKKRLKEAYIGTFEQHKKRRLQMVKKQIKKAEWVKRKNLYADHITATLLGIRPKEPIRIPTATMEADYDDDFADSPKTLRAVEQARKNIAGSYLNVWNLKRTDKRAPKEE